MKIFANSLDEDDRPDSFPGKKYFENVNVEKNQQTTKKIS